VAWTEFLQERLRNGSAIKIIGRIIIELIYCTAYYYYVDFALNQGRWQKNFQGRSQRKKAKK